MNEQFLNRVLHGDCFEWLSQIEDKSISAIIADLPYGTTQNKWDTPLDLEMLWKEYKRIIKDNGAIVLFAQTPFDKILGSSNIKMLKYEWIWKKNRGTGHLNAKKMPMKNHENILVFYKKPPLYNPQMREGKPYVRKSGNGSSNYGLQVKVETINEGRYPLSVIEFPIVERTVHPTEKPLDLISYLVRTYSKEGDTILDNTAGSGTLGVSCINENRNFILMEKEWEYCEIANERIKQAKIQNSLK